MNARRIIAAIALLLVFQISGAGAAPFQPGNIVVTRVVPSPVQLEGKGNPVFLDEYTPGGGLVQSIPLPVVSSGVNHRLVIAGDSPTEGSLSRSGDGRFLMLSGYDAPVPYPVNMVGTTSSSVYRTIARVDASGQVDTTTALTDFSGGGSPGSVVSPDGQSFWMAGSTGGVRHADYGDTSSVPLNNDAATPGQLSIFNGQLFLSKDGPGPRIATVGMGLPTTTGQTLGGLSGVPEEGSPDGFLFADLSDAVPGPDTLYVADDALGLLKFSLVKSTWVSNGSIGGDADDYRSLTAQFTNGGVVLYAVRKALGQTGGGELVALTDASGWNGSLVGNPVVLATAPGGGAFRGVALAPNNLPDLTVELSGPANATPGDPIIYTITVRNAGNATASNVTVNFAVPSGLSVDDGPDADGFTGPGAAGAVPLVAFTKGLLASGASATLTLTCSTTTQATYLTAPGTPTVDPFDTIPEANEQNNSAFTAVRTVVSSVVQPSVFTWRSPFSGGWSDGSNWNNEISGGTAPLQLGRSNYILHFDASQSYVADNDLSVGTPFNLNQMNFSGSHALRVVGFPTLFQSDGSIPPSITQRGSVAADVRSFVNSDADLTASVNGTGWLTFSAGFQGSDSLIKTGPGKLVLTAQNNYPGTLRIEGGVVALTDEGGPAELIADGSFERPHFGAEGWAYRPDFTGWTMTGSAGVASRYSALWMKLRKAAR